MRQVGDTIVWLGMILVVAAVIYFTPRLASYVTAASTDTVRGAGYSTCDGITAHSEDDL
jgi:hypothetical protein